MKDILKKMECMVVRLAIITIMGNWSMKEKWFMEKEKAMAVNFMLMAIWNILVFIRTTGTMVKAVRFFMVMGV